jgi:alcohol dehydrogenase class IV
MFPIPHGVACARLLAPVAEANVRALAERGGRSAILLRYEDAARLLTQDRAADALAGAAWLRDLVEELNVPRLGAYGLRSEQVPEVVAQAKRASSMRGNAVELTVRELDAVLHAAL